MKTDKLFNGFFEGKRVFITGHTGFKGSWLSLWLKKLGAEVAGYALDPKTERDNFVITSLSDKITDYRADVRDFTTLKSKVDEFKPDIIFHLAAQALVRPSYDEPRDTFDTNVMGTVNILECLRESETAKALVNITSDKCYENKEWLWGYREIDPLGGRDPYSASKGASEIVTSSYLRSFFHTDKFYEHGKVIASVRAGNVLGGGDWSRDRIMTDSINALENGQPIKVRNPRHTRPWQHVLEPLGGYMLLASKLSESPAKYSGAWNFGPNQDSIIPVGDIADLVIKHYGEGSWEDMSDPNQPHEASLLSLDISKARFELGWEPTLNIEETIRFTIDWYKNYRDKDMFEYCTGQIVEFTSKVGWRLVNG